MKPVWDDQRARPVNEDEPVCEICGNPFALDGLCEVCDEDDEEDE